MATRAARKPRKPAYAADNERQAPDHAKPWWHLFLVYPALGVALITAAPQWFDKIGATLQGVKGDSLAAAQEQNRLWRANLGCTAAPKAWYSSPSNVKIDATICDSGDIFVRAVTPDNGEHFKWVPVKDVVQQESGGGSIIPSANAATLRLAPLIAASSPSRLLPRAQAVTVLCQRFVDGRHLLRRVQTPQGCFDEVIDTYNGAVVQRNPAPCVPQC
jgi:hypothetical protein